MAKKKSNDKMTDDILKLVQGLTPFASYLSDSALSEVSEWISTGNYALNAICSGSIYNGIAGGRITTLVGPSGSAKTYFICKVMANAQAMGYTPIYLDSENALDRNYALRVGCIPDDIIYIPTFTVEACKENSIKIMKKVIDSKTDKKFILFLDSLGNLQTEKLEKDTLAGKNAADMGLRAKMIGGMMSLWTQYAATSRMPIVFTNHIYEDPNLMYQTITKNQGGGKKVIYDPSLTLQLSSTQERAKKDSSDTGGALSNVVLGSNIRALSVKNRFAKEYLVANVYLSQQSGMSPYSGLLELAVSTGIIQSTSPTYAMGEKKLGYAKNFQDDPEFWDPLLPELDIAIRNATSLSGVVDPIDEVAVNMV